MKFYDNLTKEEYMDYYYKCNNNHFLQSEGWGYASKLNRNQDPIYCGVKDDEGNILIAALLLKKVLPFGYSYYYSPRGYVFDYKDMNVFKFFTESLKDFMKKTKAIYLKVDPGIRYQTIDQNASPIDGENNYQLFEEFIKLGYIHQGFNKLYEKNQPRYTFRIPVDCPIEEIDSKISKSFMKQIKKSFTYDFVIEEDTDAKTFTELNKLVSQKDGFHFAGDNYFQNVYDGFKKYNAVKIHNVKVCPNKLLKRNEDEIKKLEDVLNDPNTSKKGIEDQKNILARLQKEYNLLLPYKTDNDDEMIVICSMFVVYTKDILWTLYIGNNDLARDLFAVNRIYYEELLIAKEMGCKYVDLFGVTGDPNTTYKNLAGIYKYKANFGGIFYEFIGEFDLVNNKLLYKVLPIILKIYRKLKK